MPQIDFLRQRPFGSVNVGKAMGAAKPSPEHGQEADSSYFELSASTLIDRFYGVANSFHEQSQYTLDACLHFENLTQEQLDAVYDEHMGVIDFIEDSMEQLKPLWAEIPQEYVAELVDSSHKFGEAWRMFRKGYRVVTKLHDINNELAYRDENNRQKAVIEAYLHRRLELARAWNRIAKDALRAFNRPASVQERNLSATAVVVAWRARQDQLLDELEAVQHDCTRSPVRSEELSNLEDEATRCVRTMEETMYPDETDERQQVRQWTQRDLNDLREKLVEPELMEVDMTAPEENLLEPQRQLRQNECGICSDAYSEPILLEGFTCCGHVFCFKCIVTWIDFRGACPLCRMPATLDQLFPLDVVWVNGTDREASDREDGEERLLDILDDMQEKLARMPGAW